MSKEACAICGQVVSTTHSPNKREGYFVDDVALESMQRAIENDPVGFYPTGYVKRVAKCRRLTLCGLCREEED